MEASTDAPYLFVRALRQVDHTVFCVQDGQKTYYDQQFERSVAYSSGQQVKRSILDAASERLEEPRAPITFNKVLETDKDGNETLTDGEPWSPCDPRFADQLLGGWMRARKGGGDTIRRRSPLSISAMRPLHPLLANTHHEIASFDRSDQPEQHPVRVVNSDDEELSDEQISEFLESNDRMMPRRKWIPEDQVGPRAHGLYVFDVAIDLRRLFSVSVNKHEPELARDMIEDLEEAGWVRSESGERLICPSERREEIITALAQALVQWRVTSNQSRTFSPQPTLAMVISDDANRVTGAIRADLEQEGSELDAVPVVTTIDGADTFASLTCKGYVPGVSASADALDEATKTIEENLQMYDYAA
jgi:hypothetical protein